MNTENILLKLCKTVVGTVVGVIVAEGVAISANAALDDAEMLKRSIQNKLSPEPEPVKRWGRKGK